MQAKLKEHSLLLTHSGLQFGGELINPGKQEHEGDSPDILHCELGPHGDGRQGFIGGATIVSSKSCTHYKTCLN